MVLHVSGCVARHVVSIFVKRQISFLKAFRSIMHFPQVSVLSCRVIGKILLRVHPSNDPEEPWERCFAQRDVSANGRNFSGPVPAPADNWITLNPASVRRIMLPQITSARGLISLRWAGIYVTYLFVAGVAKTQNGPTRDSSDNVVGPGTRHIIQERNRFNCCCCCPLICRATPTSNGVLILLYRD